MDMLLRYSGEVLVDVRYYDPCIGAVVVVGFSMNVQMAGQVIHCEFVPSIISSQLIASSVALNIVFGLLQRLPKSNEACHGEIT